MSNAIIKESIKSRERKLNTDQCVKSLSRDYVVSTVVKADTFVVRMIQKGQD